MAGCASNQQLLTDPARNQQLNAELSRQPFGGRWWDLYARAAIYQKYELWDLAEKDLRAAITEWLPRIEKRDRAKWLADIDAMKANH